MAGLPAPIRAHGPAGWLLSCLVAASLLGCSDRTPVVLGFMGDLTGRAADLGVGGRDAATLAIEEANAAGGLRGRAFELLAVDDRQDSRAAQLAYDTLQAAGVELVIGPMTSAVMTDIKPKADRGAMLLISPTVTSSAFDGQDDRLFRVIASTREYARKSAWFHAERQGLRRLAVVLDDNNLAFTQRWLDDFEAEFVRLGGRIISRVSYDLQAIPSFNQIVAGALAGQPDGLLILANAADAALLVQQARKLAPTVPLLSSEWSATDAFLALAGAAAEGVYQSQFIDRSSFAPAYLDFVPRFRHRFGRDPGFAEVAAYDATRVALQALAARREGEDLKQTLLRVGRFDGLQQPVAFNATGDAQRETYITVVRQGRYMVEP